ncbi:MAG TPA: TlpA disulfide reductase family protein [Chitinophagaceae bacterium]
MNLRTSLAGVACAVLLSTLSLCAQQSQGGPFEVNGFIRGMNNDSLVIFISNFDKSGKQKPADTIITRAVNDRFSFKGNIQKPTLVWAQVGGLKSRRSFSFFLEKGNIIIEGSVEKLDEVNYSGTAANNDLAKTRGYTSSVFNRIRMLRIDLKNQAEGSAGYNAIMNDIAKKFDSIQNYELDFLKNNPHSFVSGIYLYVRKDRLPVDELEKLYNKLSDEVKQGDMVAMLPAAIAAKRSVAIGKTAHDFTAPDTTGKMVRFSDFKGKYVLLEFWASWCVPCRKESPNLVRLYNQYERKGFTILQFSLDDNSTARQWREAIRKDGLTWTQVSDLSGLHSEVAKLYGVQPIPDNFLIDPSGKILARGLQGEALESRLKELLK